MDDRKTKKAPRARTGALSRDEVTARTFRWVCVLRSTLAALVDSIDATRDEMAKADSPLRALLDADALRTLYSELREAECQANVLGVPNPMNLVIPFALNTTTKEGA